jgi:uncharacterized protein YqeY
VLRDRINTALKDAMKERAEQRVSTLRLVNAAIQDADIQAQVHGRGLLSDDALLPVLQKMIKQRQESAEIYDRAGRRDLADKERAEIEIIGAYLPQQMSEVEMEGAIRDAIRQAGAAGMKDMGRVMASLKERYAGKMDFGKASALVKAMLAA